MKKKTEEWEEKKQKEIVINDYTTHGYIRWGGWMDGCVEGLGDTKVMHVCHVWKVGKLTVKR